MSYQNGTTHFNLPQTVGSDKRDWFDTNEAFRDVDEALHSASVDSGTALDQIAQANVDIQAVDAKADGIDTRLTEVEGKQSTDEENIAQNSLAISNLSNKVDEVDTDLAEMIEVTEEQSATASVEHVVGSYFRYNGNLWRTTVLIRVGDEIVPNVNCETTDVMTRIEALEGASPTPTGSEIDDSVTALNKTWSSSKIDTLLVAKADDSALTTLAGKVGDLADLDTTDKTSLVHAVNELVALIGQIGGGGVLNAKYVVNFAGYDTTRGGMIITISDNESKTVVHKTGATVQADYDNTLITINSADVYAVNLSVTKDAYFFPEDSKVPVIIKAGTGFSVGYNVTYSNGTLAFFD